MNQKTLPRSIAVVLSGAGHTDGSEITEAVASLIAISEAGASYQCFAPDMENDSGANVLLMSQRIARGKAKPLQSLHAEDFDGLVFPGGFGAATILSDFASKGAKASLLPDVARVIKEFHAELKPIGFICIAPTLAAIALGKSGVEITLGSKGEAALAVEKLGALHTECPVHDYISDRDHKILSTPAYMYDDAKPDQVFLGIRKMIRELVEMS